MRALLIAVTLATALPLVLGHEEVVSTENRTFSVDYERNEFLLDGKPFRYVSGSFHYFRALPQVWTDRFRALRACGFNAVDTYIEWSFHNPRDGEYAFSGIADIESFIGKAQAEGLYVILRPGPYICAERDNGGLPFWLIHKYPEIQVRTSDANFLKEVRIWYRMLMPRLQKFFYGNGGPIIMVQVENEYGAYKACDRDYLNWLRDEIEHYVHGKAVLFTTDIPDERISCGKIEGVLATTDFGIDKISEIDNVWSILRSVQPKGPLVNSEYYTGWLMHWQEENQRRDPTAVAQGLRKILSYGASVNLYMFFGGTNFGYRSGANDWGPGKYMPDITSYDYDAVLDESGDPTTKYELIRNVLKDFMSMPPVDLPPKSHKTAYGNVQMKPIVKVLSRAGLGWLVTQSVESQFPKTFEELNQFSGLVLYETVLPQLELDPSVLTVNGLHDRALVYIEGYYMGTLSRSNSVYSLPINGGIGENLQILVENQGRINFNISDDTKGILGAVTIQLLNGTKKKLLNWTSSSLPMTIEQIEPLVEKHKHREISTNQTGLLFHGPVVFYGTLEIADEPTDTYIDTSNWGKGVLFINKTNLGRYWPIVGPQITHYVPKYILRKGSNDIVLIEFQRAPSHMCLDFTDSSRIDDV